ncbi:hypothetical protein BDQ17DRAFT_1265213, partial [Cyathus striatus]
YPREAVIGEMFLSDPLVSDPRNHCILILETLIIPDEDDAISLVKPFLTTCLHPKFGTIGELMEMFCQLFEVYCIAYKHDCKEDNFMMDGLPLYSSTLYPGNLTMNLEYTSRVTYTTRSLHLVKYCVIDFRLSLRYA